MSKKGRNDLTSVVNSNLYDNNNKEILAAMLRAVLQDYRDSHFNLVDDQLKSNTYQFVSGNPQTLEQYLNTVIGSLPIYGAVQGIDVGSNQPSLTTSGIISSASGTKSGSDSLLNIVFSQSIANRRLIPVLTTTSPNWNEQNDICTPVIRRISSTNIHVGLREMYGHTQNLILEIIAL